MFDTSARIVLEKGLWTLTRVQVKHSASNCAVQTARQCFDINSTTDVLILRERSHLISNTNMHHMYDPGQGCKHSSHNNL